MTKDKIFNRSIAMDNLEQPVIKLSPLKEMAFLWQMKGCAISNWNNKNGVQNEIQFSNTSRQRLPYLPGYSVEGLLIPWCRV